MKKRLDVLLVERGLAETRSQAQALVLAGRVKGFDKAGVALDPNVPLELTERPRFVSRGGEKLAHALEILEMDVSGENCLDLGSSTGGFTDCLLQAGAARVCALDVGRDQLHERIKNDARVTVLERTNARRLTCDDLPFQPAFVTCDVSFISIRLALPPALACASPGWRALVLVKPQFEAGRAEVGRGGVVRDPDTHRRVLSDIARAVPTWGAALTAIVDSGLPGPKGNREFFLSLRDAARACPEGAIDDWINAAVG